jgi:HD-GYP domain-containing protein (c-di-GMP phosphodiesterase class II)
MTSNRQYRKALMFQQALDELERCRGSQLDSDMVDVFCRMVQNRGFWKQMQEDMHDCAPTQMISEHAH